MKGAEVILTDPEIVKRIAGIDVVNEYVILKPLST
jgi:hypothetical protein